MEIKSWKIRNATRWCVVLETRDGTTAVIIREERDLVARFGCESGYARSLALAHQLAATLHGFVADMISTGDAEPGFLRIALVEGGEPLSDARPTVRVSGSDAGLHLVPFFDFGLTSHAIAEALCAL